MLPHSLTRAELPAAVLTVLRTLIERGYPSFLVGGCVRDLLRGAPPKDFDIATAARPEQVQASFRKVLPTGLKHGTVTVLERGHHVEVTTFRIEGDYVDGRRPETVEFHGDVREDLGRRDFTINAMAFDPVGGELVDPWGGQEDLVARRVRCVRDPAARFGEDGLRTLRAVRFATVLDFALDPATEAAIPGALDVFSKVSLERVTEELGKTLRAPAAARGLELLRTTGLLGVALPELAAAAERAPGRFTAAKASVTAALAELEVRLAVLVSATYSEGARAGADALLARLKLPTKSCESVQRMVSAGRLMELTGASDADLRRFLARTGAEHLSLFLAHARALAQGEAEGSARIDALARHFETVLASKPALTPKELALKGADLMRVLGVGPSPVIGEATRHLMERVLEEPALNTAGQLTELLRTWRAARS